MRTSNLVLMGILAMSLPIQAQVANHVDDTWLLTYQGKSTGAVRWDKRFPALLRSGLPHYRVQWWDNRPLPEAAFTLLSGPTDMVATESNRYATLSAAAEGVAFYKGLLWVDTGASQPKMIFAYLLQDQFKLERASLTLYTKNNDLAAKLPPQFLAALSVWQAKHGIPTITSFTVVDAEGKITHPPLAALGSN